MEIVDLKQFQREFGTRYINEDIERIELLEMLYAPFNDDENNNPNRIKSLIYKKDSVGIRDLYDRNMSRLEIKIPNGSTEYKVWIDNIRLFGKIVEVSRHCADVMRTGEANDRDIKMLELKEELSDSEATLEEKLYILMDLLFEDDETKQIYIERFYSLESKIEKSGTNKYNKPVWCREPSFGKVDFEQQYYSRIEETKGIISFDFNTGKYEILDGRNKGEYRE